MLLLMLWGTCLICAWTGIGHMALVLTGAEERSWPFNAVIGVAVLVTLGGWMNLAGLIHSPELITIVVLGDLLFLFYVIRNRAEFAKCYSAFLKLAMWARVLAVGCTLLLLVITVHSLTFAKFSTFDDVPAYLTFPVKLLQFGSLPFEPFSERRVQAGLGANYFLQAFMLVIGDVRSLWFIDAGAGLILFVGCIFRAARKLGNSIEASLGLAALVLAVPLSHINLTYTVLPAAVFVSMFLVGTSERTSPMRGSVLLGLLAATVSLLKSTYLPPALLIAFGIPLLRFERKRWLRTVGEAMLAVLVFAFILLPWMVDMGRKEGTMLYPLLGKGYDIAAYGPVPHWINPGHYPIVLGLAMLVALASAAWVHFIVSRGYPYSAEISLLLLVGGVVAVPISVAVAGSSLLRYVSPFELPFCFLFLGSLMRIREKGARRLRFLQFSYAYACVSILAIESYAITHSHFDVYIPTKHGQIANFDDATVVLDAREIQTERDRAARLQRAIPAGQPVYADFMVTFPMDFRRNDFYVADFPGMASLPPGMPTQGSPMALRSYLLSRSIRFVAYSSRLAALREAGLSWPMGRSGTWPFVESINSVDVDHEIEALARTNRVIYDDGDNKVIDLLQPQPH